MLCLFNIFSLKQTLLHSFTLTFDQFPSSLETGDRWHIWALIIVWACNPDMRSKEIKGKLDSRQGLFFSPAAQSIANMHFTHVRYSPWSKEIPKDSGLMTKKQINKENKEHEISVNQNQLLKPTFTKLNVWYLIVIIIVNGK